jgi:hypothetical protein
MDDGNRRTQVFDCHVYGRDHDFYAGGTVAEYVVLVRQLSIAVSAVFQSGAGVGWCRAATYE